MNPHFRALSDDVRRTERIPNRGYGRIDHIELPTDGTRVALIAVDLIDADWLDAAGQRDEKLSLVSKDRRSEAWQSYSFQLRGPVPPSNPFDQAPLYRLEIELPIGQSWFGLPVLPPRDDQAFELQMGALEAKWLEFERIERAAPHEVGAALLYDGLFADPIAVTMRGRITTQRMARALTDVFSLRHFPTVTRKDIELALSRASADLLSVYDVGQGNANALVQGNHQATLYYDLGAGVYRNKKTTPVGLTFCLSLPPNIILSHWDADHWAGANATLINGQRPALRLDWIAPLQAVGPTHAAFAHDIVSNGGHLRLYRPKTILHNNVVGSATMRSGHTAKFTTGKGHDRNGTGIVIVIENRVANHQVCWLLTGDCDYRHFLPSLTNYPPVAIVAPHHGANLGPATNPPSPAQAGTRYARLAYSFGKDNAHGGTGVQHPTAAGVQAHAQVGWNHGPWNLASPGHSVPGADVLATCQHSPGTFRGGAVIGWVRPPPPYGLPCGGAGCTATVIQS